MKAFGKSQGLEGIFVDHLGGHLAHIAVFHKFFDHFNIEIRDIDDACLLFWKCRVLDLVLQKKCGCKSIIGCPSVIISGKLNCLVWCITKKYETSSLVNFENDRIRSLYKKKQVHAMKTISNIQFQHLDTYVITLRMNRNKRYHLKSMMCFFRCGL